MGVFLSQAEEDIPTSIVRVLLHGAFKTLREVAIEEWEELEEEQYGEPVVHERDEV